MFDLLRVNEKARKNKAQTCQAENDEDTWDSVNEKTKAQKALKENKR